MLFERAKQIVKNLKKGNFVMVYERPLKTLKSAPNGLVIAKQVRIVVRFGIEFKNTNYHKTKVLNGFNSDGSLPWGGWEIYKFFIEHKGEHYLRYFKSSFSHHKPKVKYICNGEELTSEKLEELVKLKYISSSELKSSENESGCYTINIKHIKTINGLS